MDKLMFILLVGAVLLFYIYVIPARRSSDYNTKHKIDSLNTLVIQLSKEEKYLDSISTLYKDSAAVLDRELILKQKELIKQREQYGKEIKTARSYTPTQLDSFFASRFKCK